MSKRCYDLYNCKMMQKLFCMLNAIFLIFFCISSTTALARTPEQDGPKHTNTLYRYKFKSQEATSVQTDSSIKILINTSGSGPLTGISPIDEKDYWIQLLSSMNSNYQIDWYDGVPNYGANQEGDLNLYDIVIYDAGGYWHPLSSEVDPLFKYHSSGRPMIVVAPDINYDWLNIKKGTIPDFPEKVLHIGGVRGTMPKDAFSIIANTGHEIISNMATGIEIPVASNSSYPDCFSPLNEDYGVLRQGIATTEFDNGTVLQDPSSFDYGPSGNLYSVIAYPGNNSEGRVVLFGFPPTAIEISANLDQLCQNAINYCLGEVKQTKKVKLERLYIDDSGDNSITVNKAKGDYVEIFHLISSEESLEQDLTLTLTVPTDWIFQQWYIRDDFEGTNNKDHQNLHDDLGDGKHEIQIGTLGASKTVQIGVRFKIPDNTSTGKKAISSQITLGSGIPLVSSQNTSVTVVNSAQAMIVTNRNNLYEIYGDINGETTELLKTLFSIADGKEDGEVSAVVYYADWYSDDIRKWNNQDAKLYDGTPNDVADVLDGLIEGWEDKLNPWYSSGPQYLLFVGSDAVIPFYRIKDLMNEESTHTATDVNSNNYYFSDIKYSDISGNDYMKGEIELATGRIEGANAKDLKDFILRGKDGPSNANKAFIGSDSRNDVDDVLDNLKNENYVILNESGNKITIENDKWSKAEFTTALSDDINIFVHCGHGSESLYYAGDSTTYLNSNDIPDLTALRPFISTSGCHSGQSREVDTISFDNLLWQFVHRGASGYLGSGAYVYLNGSNGKLAHGEKLFNDFYKDISDFWTADDPFGKAFKQAVKGFDVGLTWENIEKRTVTQFIYYGLPWMKPNFPSSTNAVSPKTLSEDQLGFLISESFPKKIADNQIMGASVFAGSYSKSYTFSVTDYNISQDGVFEIVNIPGAEFDYNPFEPVLPKLMATLNLPKNSAVTDVVLNGGETLALGSLNIPNSQPSTTVDPKPGFTDFADVTGLYPSVNYGFDIDNYSDHVEVKIYFIPVQHDVDTNATTLWTNAEVEVQYDLNEIVFISDFSPISSEYITTETISSSLTLENAGSNDIPDLTAVLEIFDAQGLLKNTVQSPVGNISAGGVANMSLDMLNGLDSGTYMLKVSLQDSTNSTVAISSEYIKIIAELLNSFVVPEESLNTGIDIPFTVNFSNFNQSEIMVDAKIIVSNEDGEQEAILFIPTTKIAAQSSLDIVAYWNSLEKPPGVYFATASIAVGENVYTANSQFSITGSGLLNQGWNLFSFYLEPKDNSIAQVLSSIDGKYASVWSYDHGKWSMYDPSYPGISDLMAIEAGKGYWILMNESGSIENSGTTPSNSIPLAIGWNLVGYNKFTPQEISDSLASINGKYISVWAFIDGLWRIYNPAFPEFSDLSTMNPGYGYWINATEACTWTLP